jgi:hypothetical protein
MVIIATLMLVVDASHRWFAWSLLILGSVASTAGNIVHVSMSDYSSSFTVAALAAAAPPLVLLVTTHLMIQLVRLEDPVQVDAEPDPLSAPLNSSAEAEMAVLCVNALKLTSEGYEVDAVATRTGLSSDVVEGIIVAAENEIYAAAEQETRLTPVS